MICTDFNTITGTEIPGVTTFPPRHWGVEELSVAEQVGLTLDAGADQLGGETDPELILTAVRSGAVGEGPIDASARRVLRDKFRLGLFDDPHVAPDEAARVVAPRPAVSWAGPSCDAGWSTSPAGRWPGAGCRSRGSPRP
ncbi:hypothetical protein [Streptomyces sp. NPDC053720]|uniref:hypothetical protein n=1 Tax=Streptomyces sp. NPDC053720 TaxID=3154855 RepID=UPI003415C5C7